MRAQETYTFSSPTAANSPSFSLQGGAYVLDAVGNFNGGSVTLQRLGPDGATFITAVTSLTASGTSGSVALPPGIYNILVAGATGFAVSVLRIPGE